VIAVFSFAGDREREVDLRGCEERDGSRHGARRRIGRHAERARQRDPLLERQLLRTAPRLDAGLTQRRAARSGLRHRLRAERSAELLAAVTEDVAHETEERGAVKGANAGADASQRDRPPSSPSARAEGARRDARHDLGVGERLHEHREIAALLTTRRGRRDHAARDLLLYQDHDEGRTTVVADEPLEAAAS
jgi:hypothetical protein